MGKEVVTLSHGAGGVETEKLLQGLIFGKLPPELKKVEGGLGLDYPDDAAAIRLNDGGYLLVTTDSHTVKPLFFPGGDIGTLAVSGTINDVLMMGGRPLAMLDTLVVEEGTDMDTVNRVVESMISVLKRERIPLIGGDFKVMPKGELDGIVVTTVAVGYAKRLIVDKELRPGDKIIVTGTVGDHGAVILALQHGINAGFKSDVKPLTDVMLPLLEEFGDYIHAARDPTRGGIAMVLNDWARDAGLTIEVYEEKIPVRKDVKALLDMFGIEPWVLANEGMAVLGVEPSKAEEVLEFIRSKGYRDAQIIGEARKGDDAAVVLHTVVGGRRYMEPPTGDIVPRIC